MLNLAKFSVKEQDIAFISQQNPNSGLNEFENTGSILFCKASVPFDTNLWHRRSVHANCKVLKSLCEKLDDVLRMKKNLEPCPPCKMGKATKKSFDSVFESVSHSGEIVHSNLCGKLPLSIHGNKYFCNFIDQFSQYVDVVGIKEKGLAADVCEDYKTLVQANKFFKHGV